MSDAHETVGHASRQLKNIETREFAEATDHPDAVKDLKMPCSVYPMLIEAYNQTKVDVIVDNSESMNSGTRRDELLKYSLTIAYFLT
jgi:hypothetical protein